MLAGRQPLLGLVRAQELVAPGLDKAGSSRVLGPVYLLLPRFPAPLPPPLDRKKVGGS